MFTIVQIQMKMKHFTELAVNTDPLNVVSHYTLGNVYAVLMQYNKSIDSFHQAVTIQDDLEWVKKRKAAVKVNIDEKVKSDLPRLL